MAPGPQCPHLKAEPVPARRGGRSACGRITGPGAGEVASVPGAVPRAGGVMDAPEHLPGPVSRPPAPDEKERAWGARPEPRGHRKSLMNEAYGERGRDLGGPIVGERDPRTGRLSPRSARNREASDPAAPSAWRAFSPGAWPGSEMGLCGPEAWPGVSPGRGRPAPPRCWVRPLPRGRGRGWRDGAFPATEPRARRGKRGGGG